MSEGAHADRADQAGRAGGGYGWRIGSVGGTPVFIARSWPLIIVLLLLVVSPTLRNSGRSMGFAVFVAASSGVLLLISVLVHEAAHAVVAGMRGHQVDRVVADVWGGHTVYDSTDVTPGTTALVAVVGPLSNLALALVAWLAQPLVSNDLAANLLGATAYVNLFVGVFNLLPGLPLDGGQIVSSLVWQVTGRKGTGLSAAGWLGRIVAVGAVLWFIGVPLMRGQQPSLISLVWVAMIAFFLWRGASASIRSGQIHDATAGPALSVLEPVVLVPGDTTVAAAGNLMAGAVALPTESNHRPESGASTGSWVAVTDASGWPFGLVDPAAAAAVPEVSRPTARLSAVALAQPRAWVLDLPPDAVLTELVRLMSERSLSVAIVVDAQTRRVAGLATAAHINDVVGAELSRRSRR
ncbi:MAG: site-2 protease family protein [Humibacillus sp.]|nr:site-2 protease family protein [Humibacillus sp.]MDN5778683.1 site-2 protease family protein [Humibacillus sp.]